MSSYFTQTGTFKSSLILTSICILSLLIGISGCSRGSDSGEQSSGGSGQTAPTESAEQAASAAPAAPEQPQGPVFRSKMMGMEMTEPLVAKDLSPAGLEGLTIQAPERANLEKRRTGHHLVAAGVNYSLAIREGDFNAEQTKRTFNIVDPNGTVVVDQEDLVIYQRSGANGSFLFTAKVVVGERNLTCGTVATAFAFTRNQVDQMVESCRSISAASN